MDRAQNPVHHFQAHTTGMIVRSTYQEYMGWFTGDPLGLTRMSTREQALRFCDLAGDADTMLVLARKAASEDGLSRTVWALNLASQLRICSPSAEADEVYIAALQKLAWSTSSAYVHNYYLSLIDEVQNSAPWRLIRRRADTESRGTHLRVFASPPRCVSPFHFQQFCQCDL